MDFVIRLLSGALCNALLSLKIAEGKDNRFGHWAIAVNKEKGMDGLTSTVKHLGFYSVKLNNSLLFGKKGNNKANYNHSNAYGFKNVSKC